MCSAGLGGRSDGAVVILPPVLFIHAAVITPLTTIPFLILFNLPSPQAQYLKYLDLTSTYDKIEEALFIVRGA